jgi:hypothetical protein
MMKHQAASPTASLSTASKDESRPVEAGRRLGGTEYVLYKFNRLNTLLIWVIVEVAGPLTRDVLQAAVRVTVLRHPVLRCRIERRRFVVTPFEHFMAEHPNLVDEVPDTDPQQLAGKRCTSRGRGATSRQPMCTHVPRGAARRRGA